MMIEMIDRGIPTWVKATAVALATVATLGSAYALYRAHHNALQNSFDAGLKAGQIACETKHHQAISQARADVITQAQNKLDQQQQHGVRAEQRRHHIDHQFNQLGAQLAAAHKQGAPHATAIDGSDCVLPAERLRIWQAANRGDTDRATTDHGATAIEPAGSASVPAATSQRANADAGTQPFGNSSPVSPAGSAALRPAAMAASHAAGLQPVADADDYGER